MAFFFISGALFTHTSTLDQPLRKTIKKKSTTMIIPFLFFEIWGVFSQILLFHSNLNINGYLFNTLTLQFNNGAIMWFLVVLYFSELIFIVSHHCFKNKYLHYGLSICSFVLSLIIPSANIYLEYFSRILRAVFFLNAGYYFGKFLAKKNFILASMSFMTLLMLTMHNGRIGFAEVTLQNSLYFLGGSFLGIYFTFYLSQLSWGKWLQFIGQNTMTIYLTHFSYYIAAGKLLGESDMAKASTYQSIGVFILVVLLEIPTVYFFRRYLPEAVGQKRIKLADEV